MSPLHIDDCKVPALLAFHNEMPCAATSATLFLHALLTIPAALQSKNRSKNIISNYRCGLMMRVMPFQRACYAHIEESWAAVFTYADTPAHFWLAKPKIFYDSCEIPAK